MKPILQIYSLILFEIPALKKKKLLVSRIKRELVALKSMDCDIKKKEEQIKNKYVQQLLFDKYIEKCENIKCNTNSITKFSINILLCIYILMLKFYHHYYEMELDKLKNNSSNIFR